MESEQIYQRSKVGAFWLCESCGSVVADKDAHDGWHGWVKTAVDTASALVGAGDWSLGWSGQGCDYEKMV